MSYRINFNNGAGPYEEKFEDLEEAKIAAISMMGLTGRNVTILDEEGEIVTMSEWIMLPPTEEALEEGLVLVRFGTDGYYQLWEDELETLY